MQSRSGTPGRAGRAIAVPKSQMGNGTGRGTQRQCWTTVRESLHFFGCVLIQKLLYLLTKQAQRTSVGKKRLFPSCSQPFTHPIPPQIRSAEENSPGSCCLISTRAGHGWDSCRHCGWDNFPNPILSAPCRVISKQIFLAGSGGAAELSPSLARSSSNALSHFHGRLHTQVDH